MATLAFQSQYVTPGQFGTFYFPSTVGSYLVGLSNFTYNYPNSDDHHILQLSLSMTDSFSAPHQVQVQPICVMHDDSGNTLWVQPNTVEVTVVALLDTPPGSNITFGRVTLSNGQTTQIPVQGAAPQGAVAFVRGFSFTYPGGQDHHVEEMQVGVQASPGPGQNITASCTAAQMHDNSNNQAAATVDLCVIGVSGSPGFDYGLWQATAPGPASVPLESEVTAAVALLAGFDLNYGPNVDHHVLTAQAGPISGGSYPTISTYNGRSTVTTPVVGFITDDSGHSVMGQTAVLFIGQ